VKSAGCAQCGNSAAAGHRYPAVGCVGAGERIRTELAKGFAVQLERAGKERVIMTTRATDAVEEHVDLVDQRFEQRACGHFDVRQQRTERRTVGDAELGREARDGLLTANAAVLQDSGLI